MFTGIVEAIGTVDAIRQEGKNTVFTISSPISSVLAIDQSVSHDGVCLTVTAVTDDTHEVVAVEETKLRSTVGRWSAGYAVNLERSLRLNDRLDGHLVQGHVDAIGKVQDIVFREGSWLFTFQYDERFKHLLVDKGSITINGTSLTLIQPSAHTFQVTIIPYTFEHTNFGRLVPGHSVNLEFDIIGKYLARYLDQLSLGDRH